MFRVINRVPTLTRKVGVVTQYGFATETKTQAEVLIDKVYDLVRAATSGNFAAYKALNSPTSTCIEPETRGNIISGLAFHEHYFSLPADPNQAPSQTTLTNVRAKVCCESKMGFVTYNRVTQRGVDVSVAQETRIWEKDSADEWVQVHFHKSLVE